MSTEPRNRLPGGYGCPLIHHAGGNPPSEYEDDYSRGAWMGPPIGAVERRRVCDACVKKIESGKSTTYKYNPKTGEVTKT